MRREKGSEEVNISEIPLSTLTYLQIKLQECSVIVGAVAHGDIGMKFLSADLEPVSMTHCWLRRGYLGGGAETRSVDRRLTCSP